MGLDRRRLLIGYWLTFGGLLLAFLVAGLIPVPEPPPCNTAVCNISDYSVLLGLGLVIIGMVFLSAALFGKGSSESPPAPAFSPAQYSFTPVPPPAVAPLPTSPPTEGPSTRVGPCPGCGASVTSEYGFCPRCGRTLTR